MNSDNKTARTVGVLFVTGIVTYFLSDEFLLGPIIPVWSMDRAFLTIPNLTVASGIGKVRTRSETCARAPAVAQPPPGDAPEGNHFGYARACRAGYGARRDNYLYDWPHDACLNRR